MMLNRVASSETQIIVNSFIEAIDPIGITHDTFSDVYTDVHIAQKNLINCIAYFSNLKHDFTVMAMSKSWFKDMKADVISIDGYLHVYDHRW